MKPKTILLSNSSVTRIWDLQKGGLQFDIWVRHSDQIRGRRVSQVILDEDFPPILDSKLLDAIEVCTVFTRNVMISRLTNSVSPGTIADALRARAERSGS